jgi:hypothetical protein
MFGRKARRGEPTTRLLHEHRNFRTINGIGTQVDQPVGRNKLMSLEPGQDFARVARNKLDEFHLVHDTSSALAIFLSGGQCH